MRRHHTRHILHVAGVSLVVRDKEVRGGLRAGHLGMCSATVELHAGGLTAYAHVEK